MSSTDIDKLDIYRMMQSSSYNPNQYPYLNLISFFHSRDKQKKAINVFYGYSY